MGEFLPETKVIIDWVQAFFVTVFCIAAVGFAQKWVSKLAKNKHGLAAFLPYFAMLALAGVAVVAIVLALPIGEAGHNQVFTLLQYVIAAIFALSGATVVSNLMAGFMLRGWNNFRPGNFIRVNEHFGRVTETGMLHTEIQTEERCLTTIPNLCIVQNASTVIPDSGTVISASVSLGYDVPRAKIEQALLRGASKAGLREPWVSILELGDYSVVYRLAGLLDDVKYMISSRSKLLGCMLDALHHHDIEIVSPAFENQRNIDNDQLFIPVKTRAPQAPASSAPEDKVFDKAEKAAQKEDLAKQRAEVVDQLEALEKELKENPDETKQAQLDALQEESERLAQLIAAHQEELDAE